MTPYVFQIFTPMARLVKTCVTCPRKNLALPWVLFTPLRRHANAYYKSCTTKLELNNPFTTTLEIAITFTKLGTVIV